MSSKHRNISYPILLAFLLLVGVDLFGQQQVQLSQYFNNYSFYNPSFSGRNYQTNASLIYRSQWVGLDGSPKSTVFGVSSRLMKLNLGYGLDVVGDQIGNYSFVGVRAAISSEKRFGLNSVRFGIAPAFYTHRLSRNFDALDNASNDPVLQGLSDQASYFDLNLGISLHNSDYFAGISVLNLLSSRVNTLAYQNRRTLVMMGGYKFSSIGIDGLEFYPNALIKTDLQNLSGVVLELTSRFTYRQNLLFGLGYRLSDAFYPLLGYQWYSALGKFAITYSYDYTTSNINLVSKGSHELSINYSYFIQRRSVIEQYRDVRFL